MKSKIAISLDEHVLSSIDGSRAHRSRSAYIETLLRDSLARSGLRSAVILAGGEGTRLRPITYEIPKPLVPVKGKPILHWQIELLRRSGIDNIVIALQYQAEKIKAAIGDGVTYMVEPKPMGTGGALLGAKDHVHEPFIVMNGDLLFYPPPNIAGMHAFHRDRKSFATFLVTMKPDVARFGKITLADDGRITEFREKPPEGGPGLISTGVYVFEPGIFDAIPGPCSLERDVFPKIQQQGLYGFFYNGGMYDVGTLSDYERAIQEWKPR